MRPVDRWLVVVTSLFAALGSCGAGRAAVSDHLFWGQILQGRIYDDPAFETPRYVFELELETDANVVSIEFLTPTGYDDVIPGDESTSSDEIETFHWVYDSTHVWEYWGYFLDPGVVEEFYGDGEYVVVLHYADGSEEQTTVWYGIPETTQAIAAPTQEPNLTWPPYDGVVASPVTFEWDPVTDPNVWDIYLGVTDANDQYAVLDVYDPNRTASASYGLIEGTYDTELSFENFYPITNPDGIPFDVLKMTTLLHPFEVVYSAVYRFWSPVMGGHFYTVDQAEKDELIDTRSAVWTFEGAVFHAWATKYFPDLRPVHRFWSDVLGAHFYTIDEDERDWVLGNYPDVWTYEGVAFYAYPEDRQPADALPVYRFWNTADCSHFYTISEQEVNTILTEYPDIFVPEGIAFYAYE